MESLENLALELENEYFKYYSYYKKRKIQKSGFHTKYFGYFIKAANLFSSYTDYDPKNLMAFFFSEGKIKYPQQLPFNYVWKQFLESPYSIKKSNEEVEKEKVRYFAEGLKYIKQFGSVSEVLKQKDIKKMILDDELDFFIEPFFFSKTFNQFMLETFLGENILARGVKDSGSALFYHWFDLPEYSKESVKGKALEYSKMKYWNFVEKKIIEVLKDDYMSPQELAKINWREEQKKYIDKNRKLSMESSQNILEEMWKDFEETKDTKNIY